MILGLAALLIALGWGIGIAGLAPEEVFLAFPISLFLTLFSVTLLMKVAEENHTFEKLTALGVRLCRGHLRALPFLIYLLSALLSAFGLGNIASTALMVPAAIAIGRNLKLDPFLMSLLVIGGANASVMSPFSPTGLIARKIISEFPITTEFSANGSLYLFLSSFLLISLVHLGGFLLLGGARWLRDANHQGRVAESSDTFEHWTQRQLVTLVILGLFFGLNLVFGIDAIRSTFPVGIQNLGAEIAFIAIFCLLLARLFRIASIDTASRHIPWGLMILISGMATLISTIEKVIGFGGVTSLATHAGSDWALVAILSLTAATFSIFSSSSGVVMPLLLPMVPALVASGFGVNPLFLVIVIVVSSHFVDCSPFSSLGALAIASMKGNDQDSNRLFRRLMLWGLAMILVSALVTSLAYLLFAY